jgi:hypothetical protein
VVQVSPILASTGSALWLHPVKAAGFIDDSSLGGNLFYWQRQRDSVKRSVVQVSPIFTVVFTVWVDLFSITLTLPVNAIGYSGQYRIRLMASPG